jgi:hypothetical protein
MAQDEAGGDRSNLLGLRDEGLHGLVALARDAAIPTIRARQSSAMQECRGTLTIGAWRRLRQGLRQCREQLLHVRRLVAQLAPDTAFRQGYCSQVL